MGAVVGQITESRGLLMRISDTTQAGNFLHEDYLLPQADCVTVGPFFWSRGMEF